MKSSEQKSPLKQYMLLITYAVLLVMFFIQKKEIFSWVGTVLGYMKPFFIGIVIAYVLNAPMKLIEEKLYPRILKKAKKRDPAVERGVAVAVTVMLAIAIVTAIFAVLIPQLIESASGFVSNIESYVQSLESFTNAVAERFHLDDTLWQQIESIGQKALDSIVENIQTSAPQILTTTKDVMTAVVNGLFNTIMSTIISIYLLFHKEKLLRQLRKIIEAFLPERATRFVYETATLTNTTFSKFVGGQLTETCILGVLCFIGSSILRMPYAILISVIVGVSNIVPVFGPWIGTGLSGLLLVLIDPMKALWFVIFIVVLQQVDNNLIYPKVVGSSIGLSGLWVIFALIVCGGLYGIVGIFLGIPLFAVLSKLGSDYINRRLERRRAAEAAATAEASSAEPAQDAPAGESVPESVPQEAPGQAEPAAHTGKKRKGKA